MINSIVYCILHITYITVINIISIVDIDVSTVMMVNIICVISHCKKLRTETWPMCTSDCFIVQLAR